MFKSSETETYQASVWIVLSYIYMDSVLLEIKSGFSEQSGARTVGDVVKAVLPTLGSSGCTQYLVTRKKAAIAIQIG